MVMQIGTKARQDKSLSLAAGEFVWEEEGESPVHRLVKPIIVKLLRENYVSRVLDLGCGNGAFTNSLYQEGFKMEGVDSSCSGIGIARDRYPWIPFSRLDLMSEHIGDGHIDQFDAVVSVEVIEHLLLPRMLMQNAMRALRPGGLLILSTPYHGYWKNLALAITNGFDAHWHPLRDYGHVKFFSKQTLVQLVQEYQLEEIQFETAGRISLLANSMIVHGLKGAV